MPHSSTGVSVPSSVYEPSSTPSPTRVSDGTRRGVAVRGTCDWHSWYHPLLVCSIFNIQS